MDKVGGNMKTHNPCDLFIGRETRGVVSSEVT
jgi:hypothetical protein